MTQWLINFARWITTGAGLMPLLADAVLKATALLVVAWLASLLFRRSSAAMRHLVWTVALVGSLALPLLLPVVPRWSVPLLPQEVSPATFEAYTLGNAPATLGSAPATRGDAGASSAPVLPNPPAWSLAVSPTAVLMAIWGTVAIGLLVRLIYAMARVRPLARRAATGAPWLPLAEDLAARSGVTRRVTFVEGPADTMPMTWGFWRPVVLVPEGADAWPESRLRTVLLHELAHVARYDCLTQTVAGVVCAIYWFNPLAWMAASRLVTERERACDDAVLAAGADGPDYAEQLLDVARLMRPHGVLTWASVSMARRSQLEGRLLAILDPDLPRRVPTRAAAAVFAAFLIVLVPSLAAIEAGPRASASIDTAVSVPQANGEAMSLPTTEGAATQAAGQAVTPRPAPQPTPKPMPTPTPTPKVAGPGHDDATRQPVDQKVIDALTTALKDIDAEVREHVVMALGRLHDRRATAPLIAALADSSADLRESAAMALGQLRDPAAVEPVVALLADKAPGVREQAAYALGQLRDPRAVEPLLAAIADANADVREQVVFALSQLRDKRATPKLIGALSDADADVREQAAFALSQLRDPSAAPALALLLSDKDAQVRERAAFALGQLRSPAAVDGLIAALKDPSAGVQEQAAFALSQIRDRRSVDPLIAALGSASPDVREQAAFALGQIRDARATDALIAAMKDANADVRKAAAFALSQVIGRQE